MLKRNSELKSEHRQLEEKDRLLNNAVKVGHLTGDTESPEEMFIKNLSPKNWYFVARK